jgi:hypothetical protein
MAVIIPVIEDVCLGLKTLGKNFWTSCPQTFLAVGLSSNNAHAPQQRPVS